MPNEDNKNIQKNTTAIAVIMNDMNTMKEDIKEIKVSIKEGFETLDYKFVSKNEFDPVRKVVYGLVGVILTAVVMAILALIIKGGI